MDAGGKKESKDSSGTAIVVAVVAVIFVLLPLLYVGAIGPIIWLHDREYIHVDSESVIEKAYSPLGSAAEMCRPLQVALHWYMELWRSATPAPTQPMHSY